MFQIDRGKTASAARNWINFAPKQTWLPLPLLISPSFFYGCLTLVKHAYQLWLFDPKSKNILWKLSFWALIESSKLGLNSRKRGKSTHPSEVSLYVKGHDIFLLSFPRFMCTFVVSKIVCSCPWFLCSFQSFCLCSFPRFLYSYQGFYVVTKVVM